MLQITPWQYQHLHVMRTAASLLWLDENSLWVRSCQMNVMSWRCKFVYVSRITVFVLERIICSTAVSFDFP